MEKNKLSDEGSFMTVAKARGHTDFSLTISGKYWNDEVEALHKQYMHGEESPAAPAVDAAKLDELGKLKALAEAATGGEWTIGLFGQLSVQDSKSMLSDCDAQYIRAAQPAAILRIAALVAQQAARIEELARERTQQRMLMSAALADLYQRMEKSYSAEPTRRITFMDLDAVHEHVVRLGLGGCLDAALESEGK